MECGVVLKSGFHTQFVSMDLVALPIRCKIGFRSNHKTHEQIELKMLGKCHSLQMRNFVTKKLFLG